jgi:heptosyltransferase-3
MGSSPQQRPVVLIRINCVAELLNTSATVDKIREHFPDTPLFAVSAPRSEALSTLQSDPRIDKVIILAPTGRSRLEKAFAAIKSLRSIGPVRATIVCCGATYGLNYNRHLLTSLFFGGTKYMAGADGTLIRLSSGRGLAAVFGAIRKSIGDSFAKVYLIALYGKEVSPDSPGTGILRPDDRALAIRLDSIGDVIATLPVIQAISQEIGAPVDMLVRQHIAPLLVGIPFIGKVHTYDHVHLLAYNPATHKLIHNLRQEKYDIVLELTGNSFAARLFSRLSGSRRRVGIFDPGHDQSMSSGLQFLTDKIPAIGGTYTERDNHVAHALEIAGPLAQFCFAPTDISAESVRQQLNLEASKPYAVLHMRASTAFKCWRPERFAQIADHLVQKYEFEIVLSGSRRDRDYNDGVATLCRHPERVINIAGKIDMPDIPALYDGADLVVSVDTGPAHIAAATRAPIVILGPRENAPFGKDDCIVAPDIEMVKADSHNPLNAISVEDVIQAIDKRLVNKI